MIIQGTNLSMIRGDSEAILLSVKDSKGVMQPLEEGDKIYLTVKESLDTAAKSLQVIVTEFEEGKALITINPSDTKELKPGVYFYDIQLNRKDGSVKTIIKPSRFVIEKEVTYD